MADRQETGTGRVIAAHGRRGLLDTQSEGPLPYLIQGRRLRVVCGDQVDWVFDDPGTLAIVTAVKPRHNTLERQPAGRPGTEVLAANLSLLVVVCAPTPLPDWFLTDRYLCTGELMGCRVLLVNNKADLPGHANSHENMLHEYRQVGYTCLSVSAHDGLSIDTLADSLHGETGILVGQSGVGKSSIINCLVPDADIAVGAVSAATREGTHTTTASRMHDLENGGRLIDTPGVRDFVPAIPQPESVQHGFPEILAAAEQCRFNNCRHLREPDCGVKAAVEDGAVTQRRYESYKRLLRTVTG